VRTEHETANKRLGIVQKEYISTIQTVSRLLTDIYMGITLNIGDASVVRIYHPEGLWQWTLRPTTMAIGRDKEVEMLWLIRRDATVYKQANRHVAITDARRPKSGAKHGLPGSGTALSLQPMVNNDVTSSWSIVRAFWPGQYFIGNEFDPVNRWLGYDSVNKEVRLVSVAERVAWYIQAQFSPAGPSPPEVLLDNSFM
jgi:hypothetical protein